MSNRIINMDSRKNRHDCGCCSTVLVSSDSLHKLRMFFFLEIIYNATNTQHQRRIQRNHGAARSCACFRARVYVF